MRRSFDNSCESAHTYCNLVSGIGERDSGKDACQGNSGGPVGINLEGTDTLVGVVSWGHGCARRLKYGVYTRVSEVANWGNETMSVKY